MKCKHCSCEVSTDRFKGGKPCAEPAAALLRRRVVTSSGCWEWTGARNPKGYGVISHHGTALVHRLAAHVWLDYDLASPLRVLHRCDDPPCFNPDHLFVGTVAENQADMAAKERAPNRRLTADDVREIRRVLATGVHHHGLPARFGVTRHTIQHIRDGRIYRWVD